MDAVMRFVILPYAFENFDCIIDSWLVYRYRLKTPFKRAVFLYMLSVL